LSKLHAEDATSQLPGILNKGLNEVFLFHGTAPEVILSIISGGANERYSTVAAFGNGNYFAEDAGKSDQYVKSDKQFDSDSTGAFGALHQRLYSRSNRHPNEKVFYLMLFRVTMGAIVRTPYSMNGPKSLTNLDNPSQKIFPDPEKTRELIPITGITPQVPYHGLVVEKAGDSRYREFLIFNGVYAYPEYLIAYRRE
jgi:hypothetical protein